MEWKEAQDYFRWRLNDDDYRRGFCKPAEEAAVEALGQPKIVRCKDCVYYSEISKHWCELLKIRFDKDAFCSYGKEDRK